MPKAPALTGGVNGAITQARKAELDKAEAALKAAEAKPPAKVIDPTAPSTVVALKITKIEELRRQLDDIATDVVNYQCDVVFQTLLAKRVSKRDARFALQQAHEIHRNQPAQVVLTPRRAE
uniref:Bacteriophage protein n=1 Tax=Steinernema glaseri TaxID=37863 RepID=A0A1I7YAF5_9BILA